MSNCNCGIDIPSRLPKAASRRDILRFGLAGAGIAALGPLGKVVTPARAAPLQQKRTVIINNFGGSDTTNMFIPTTLEQYYVRRPTISIQPEDAENLNTGPGRTSDYVLHPAMPGIAQMWRDGDVAAVNRVGYPQANLSHFTSMDIHSLGVRNDFHALGVKKSGWIARYADLYAPTALGCVAVGTGRPLDFVGGSSSPFLVNSLASFRLNAQGRSYAEQTPEHVHRLAKARNAIARWSKPGSSSEARTALLQAHDLTDAVQDAVASFTTNANYSNRRLSRQMADISRLIQGGFETKIFFTGSGGHDTHGAQGAGNTDGRQYTLMKDIDDAVTAFATDMKDQGLWDDTVIIILTEFGRRNFENGSLGTDHGAAYCELILGGRVNGGVHGPDLTDADLLENWLSYEVDFRTVYKEVLKDHMGVNPEPVFPEALEKTHNLGIAR